ncbi:MAG: hypothetical protein ACRDGM_17195 [bacterium]
MKRDPKGRIRQTATEYAQEIRRWGRYTEQQIRDAVTYALDRGTILADNAEGAAAPEGIDNVEINLEVSNVPDKQRQLIEEIVLRLLDLAGIHGFDRLTTLKGLVTQMEQEVRADRRKEYD